MPEPKETVASANLEVSEVEVAEQEKPCVAEADLTSSNSEAGDKDSAHTTEGPVNDDKKTEREISEREISGPRYLLRQTFSFAQLV